MPNYPNNASFAFTIFDDTDESTIDNIRPVYDFLRKIGIITTKSVWPLPTKEHHLYSSGDSLADHAYCTYIQALRKDGFEIALHNVGSGCYVRPEIIKGFEVFKEKLGDYPTIHVNHSSNRDNIYWRSD